MIERNRIVTYRIIPERTTAEPIRIILSMKEIPIEASKIPEPTTILDVVQNGEDRVALPITVADLRVGQVGPVRNAATPTTEVSLLEVQGRVIQVEGHADE